MKRFFARLHKKRSSGEKTSSKHYIILAGFTLLGVGLLQLAFAGVYLAAFHAPQAQSLPIAIVGNDNTTKPLGEALEQKSDNAYRSVLFTDRSEAEAQLKTQKVYAIYKPSFPKSTVTVASANGKALTDPLTTSLTELDQSYQQQARKTLAAQPEKAEAANTPIAAPDVTDIAVLPDSDRNGVTLFYVAFAAVFGGYLAAVAVNLVRGKRSFSRKLAAIRIAGFAIFSLVTSLFVASIAVHGVDAVDGSYYWTLVSISSLTTFGVSLIASSLVSLFGVFGTALVIFIFVILGTPASGGPVPLPLTGSGPWQTLAPLLPTGASFGAMRQAVYFDGAAIMQHLWTLIAYVVVGTTVLLTYGARRSSVSSFEDDIAVERDA